MAVLFPDNCRGRDPAPMPVAVVDAAEDPVENSFEAAL